MPLSQHEHFLFCSKSLNKSRQVQNQWCTLTLEVLHPIFALFPPCLDCIKLRSTVGFFFIEIQLLCASSRFRAVREKKQQRCPNSLSLSEFVIILFRTFTTLFVPQQSTTGHKKANKTTHRVKCEDVPAFISSSAELLLGREKSSLAASNCTDDNLQQLLHGGLREDTWLESVAASLYQCLPEVQ